MNNQDTDVIIIGAGPAGLMAAKKLAESDIDYILISRESTPGIDKPCGGYVPSRALDEFQLKDIRKAHPIKSIRMKFPGHELKQVDLEKSAGVNVSRENLGRALLSTVKKSPGQIWLETECNKVDSTNDGCVICYTM
ncbi:MAG: FAD-dependent monooxygenase, partial [Promethearchaeota archaeon]